MTRIAIIGFGFSGSMVAAHLVRSATSPCELYLIDPFLNPRGLAYSTPYDAHLLNVRAAGMSAFAEDATHFTRWLAQHHSQYTPQDFVPRRVYGDYLEAIWLETQEIAAQKKLSLKLVPTYAVACVKQDGAFAVMTERGDAIAVDRIVVATGNEVKPVNSAHPTLQTPWQEGALAQVASTAGPFLLIGTGLTAVDMVLALRAEGYKGQLAAYSRNGLLPQPHRDYGPAEALSATDIEANHTLRAWAGWLRRQASAASDWRAVVDGLRPFTQSAWARLRTRQQQLFFRRVASFWSIHRHRMAPQIAAQLDAEIAAGSLHVMNRAAYKAWQQTPTLAINCTGAELDVRRSANPLLRNLLAGGFIEPHANGVGVAVDAQHRVWGEGYPHVFSIGALMTGQLLESTAVPELRVQAHLIAEALWKSPSNK